MTSKNYGIRVMHAQWIGFDRLLVSGGTRLLDALLTLGDGPCMTEVTKTADGHVVMRSVTPGVTFTTRANIVYVTSSNVFLNARLQKLADTIDEIRTMDPERFYPGDAAPVTAASFVFSGARSYFDREHRRLVAWLNASEEALIWRLRAEGRMDVGVQNLGDRFGRKALSVRCIHAEGLTFGGVARDGSFVITTTDPKLQACLKAEGYPPNPIIRQHERLFLQA